MEQEREKVLHFCCPNCGGTVKWNISKQQLECTSCRTLFFPNAGYAPVREHDYASYPEQEQQQVSFPEQTEITCASCGAQIVFGAQDTAAVCPMCGSSQVMEDRQNAGVPPDGLIPFRIDETAARQSFQRWVSSLSFAPGRLKRERQQGKMVGVYLPFWTFDTRAEACYSGRGGEDYRDSDDNTQTRWTDVQGSLTMRYDDLPVCAATGPVRDLIAGILPYSTQEGSVPYDSAYLSGFLAQRYAVGADTALGWAKEGIRKSLVSVAEQQIKDRGYDRAEVKSLGVELYDVGYKHLLLPAWVSTFAYRGKSYLYLVNGETGKVVGGRPYSIPKLVAAILAGLAVLTLVILVLTAG